MSRRRTLEEDVNEKDEDMNEYSNNQKYSLKYYYRPKCSIKTGRLEKMKNTISNTV